MEFHRISAVWLALAALLVFAHAAPINGPQIVLSSTRTKGRSKFGSDNIMKINMTFDDIDLTKTPNRTLTKLPFLRFERFGVINTTAAVNEGILHKSDLDCAASWPNAIHSMPNKFGAPSKIRSNATALAAINASEYFDFVNIAIKPLRSSAQAAFVEINVWELDGKVPKNFDSLGIGYPSINGSFLPIEFEPRSYWEGWGERVNWVEIYAYTSDNEPWEFCVDNLVLEFHNADSNNEEGSVVDQPNDTSSMLVH